MKKAVFCVGALLFESIGCAQNTSSVAQEEMGTGNWAEDLKKGSGQESYVIQDDDHNKSKMVQNSLGGNANNSGVIQN